MRSADPSLTQLYPGELQADSPPGLSARARREPSSPADSCTSSSLSAPVISSIPATSGCGRTPACRAAHAAPWSPAPDCGRDTRRQGDRSGQGPARERFDLPAFRPLLGRAVAAGPVPDRQRASLGCERRSSSAQRRPQVVLLQPSRGLPSSQSRCRYKRRGQRGSDLARIYLDDLRPQRP